VRWEPGRAGLGTSAAGENDCSSHALSPLFRPSPVGWHALPFMPIDSLFHSHFQPPVRPRDARGAALHMLFHHSSPPWLPIGTLFHGGGHSSRCSGRSSIATSPRSHSPTTRRGVLFIWSSTSRDGGARCAPHGACTARWAPPLRGCGEAAPRVAVSSPGAVSSAVRPPRPVPARMEATHRRCGAAYTSIHLPINNKDDQVLHKTGSSKNWTSVA